MTPEVPQFKIPLNLPHAGKISNRLNTLLNRRVNPENPEHRRLIFTCNELYHLLLPVYEVGENPRSTESYGIAVRAAGLGRAVVEEIERNELGSDRIGQCVRNLFECLERGQEGSLLSLRAGGESSIVRSTSLGACRT